MRLTPAWRVNFHKCLSLCINKQCSGSALCSVYPKVKYLCNVSHTQQSYTTLLLTNHNYRIQSLNTNKQTNLTYSYDPQENIYLRDMLIKNNILFITINRMIWRRRPCRSKEFIKSCVNSYTPTKNELTIN